MDGLKQEGLAQVIIKSPSPGEHFKAEAHLSWRYTNYHAEPSQKVMNSGTYVAGHGCF